MDLKELKELIKNGGKVVVVENDKPVFVVVSYEDFKGAPVPKQAATSVLADEEFSDEELTLDDLPLE
ncbi:MAG: hypothetical protein Q7S63_00350 [bacterium]|nr:hypothetical protein [bacterium]